MSPGYDEIRAGFRWKVPERYNFGFDVVDERAKDPSALALISISEGQERVERHTYRDLSLLSNRFANALRRLGGARGERALVILQSVPEWYVAMIGMIKAGVVPVPGTHLLTEGDIAFRLARADAAIVVTDARVAGRVDGAAAKGSAPKIKILVGGARQGWTPYEEEMAKSSERLERTKDLETAPDDPMLIYFTSGTTAHPKMVLHSHSYPIGHEVTARYAQSLLPGDIHWTVSDTGWAKCAWGKLFGQMIVGATIIQWETPGRFDPDGLLAAMGRHGVTTFCAPPTVYRMFIQTDLSKFKLKLRHCMSAGEPLNPEVIKVWHGAFGLDIYDFFGQTETACILSNHPSFPIRYGSVGRPTPGHDVAIVDDEGRDLPPDEEGEIALKLGGGRPPGLMKEYWKDEAETARVFRHGCYFTGDRGYKDADGHFWFVGRGDDVIKSSGYRIGPFEVESAIIEHPAVAEVAVVGVPDPDGVRGTIIKAFVVLARGHAPSDELTREIQDHVKKTTAPYKYPRLIQYMPELPKTSSGKILRRDLRKLG